MGYYKPGQRLTFTHHVTQMIRNTWLGMARGLKVPYLPCPTHPALPDAYQQMQGDFSGKRTYPKQTSANPDGRTEKIQYKHSTNTVRQGKRSGGVGPCGHRSRGTRGTFRGRLESTFFISGRSCIMRKNARFPTIPIPSPLWSALNFSSLPCLR